MSERPALTILYRRAACRDLRRLPPADRHFLLLRLAAHAAGTPNTDVDSIKGSPGTLRLRWGRWRAFFSVEHGVMTVKRVKARKEAYP